MNLDEKKGHTQVKILMIVGIVMAITYFFGGIWLVLTDISFFKMAAKQQRLLGIILIIYSLYRGYMLYLRYFKKSRYTENNENAQL